MAGRKLTRQQTDRVRAQQDRRIGRLKDGAAEIDDALLGPEEGGIVSARFGRHIDVEPAAPAVPGEVVRCRLRATSDNPVTGDRVVWRRQPPAAEGMPGGGVVVARLPRSSELKRPDNYGKLKVVAANVDNVVVVFAPLPLPSSMLLDRYLAACEAGGLPPMLLLNKSDLTDQPGHAEAERLADLYARVGYRVLRCSSKQAHGLDPLRAALKGHTSVFVGQSGVGKSSLVNALLPQAALETQEVSEASGLGQHTTTTARLFHLPDGGELIDSPGVREYQLWHVSADELEDAFIDFRPWRGQCRFRDCRHLREPDCALHLAVERGELSGERLDNFLRIREGLKDAPGIRE
ncbi:MAG: small ribosomal subunit biogenesis GTPase RsgA [Gammaproteobacteria bacterium]